ncbi:hypothetical protein [Endozoicomonas sp.]|uniref:hypothetical protein n=1 Tax=Endozoicomonas sp. TaxID=1892382 RepID=UPI003AF4D9B7
MSGVPIVAVKIEHYCFNHSERAPPEKTYYTSTLKVSDHIRDTESEFHRQVNELIFSKSADRKLHIENYSLQSTHDGSIYRLLTDEGALSSNCSIPAGVPIGVMGGWLMTEQEYEVSCAGLNTMDEVRDDYAIAVSGAKGLVWDAYFDSSQMSLINDGSLRSDSGKYDKERVNVEFVIYYCPIKYNQEEMHYPVLVVVTKKEINEGDEFWVSYGKDFWALKRQRQKEKFEKLKQMKSLEQSSRIDHLFPMDHLHIGKILEARVDRLLLFKDIAATLNPPVTEGTVACRFHKAMTYMISAVDEAREDCTDEESIVNSSEVQDVAELLGIKPEKMMELVNAYQGGPSRRNLFLIIDWVKCGRANDIGELKRLTGIRKLVIRKKMSEMFNAHYEGGVTGLARYCKLPVHQAEELVQIFPEIQQVISTEPKSYMESLEESVRSQLVGITNWRLRNKLPIRNASVEKKVNQYNWPVELHSVYNYLGNIESLIKSTLGHNYSPEYDQDTSEASYDSLLTIGFDSEQLFQCQKWLQEGDQQKCYVDARKFMNYISGKSFKNKATAICRFKKQVPDGKETEFYHRVLREFKQRQRNDAMGLSNARYFHVKQDVISEWVSVVEGFDKTVKSSCASEKPSCSGGGGALTGNNRRFPSGQKKLDKSTELKIKRDMIRELCKEGQDHPSKEGVNEIIRLRYNSEYQGVTYRTIKREWMKEWYRVASSNNANRIVQHYQFTKKEAVQLLEIFRQRPQSGVSTVSKIEAKKAFIDVYLDSGGRRSFANAREKFNESYHGYTYRVLLRWQNEWKQHCSDSVSDLQRRYCADGNDIKRWKSVWEQSNRSQYSQWCYPRKVDTYCWFLRSNSTGLKYPSDECRLIRL